jgi:surfeit locus 1 family protein
MATPNPTPAATRAFRPRLLPSLLTGLMVAVTLWLGFWQLDRLEWKTDLIAQLEARTDAPPISLSEALRDPQAALYKPVRVTGRWLHARELHWVARTYRGQPGLHVVTPLRLSDGRTILVDRGWVPVQARAQDRRADGLPEGPVTVIGNLRFGGWDGREFLRPENDPAANEWLYADLDAMAAAAGLQDPITAFYLSAVRDQHAGQYPIGGRTRVQLTNNHLEYALTWFSLALVAVVVFVLSQRRRKG